MEQQKPLINLLWTGGLDSTFRLCELSRQDVIVQPYYIIDPTRDSIKQEQRAMGHILQLLRTFPETKAKLNDIIEYHSNDIKPDAEITKSYYIYADWYKLGSQYDYLARFAKQQNIKLEVGLESSSRSKACNVLRSFGELQPQSYISPEKEWSRYLIVSSDANKDCQNIFENIYIPAHLFSIEKVEEYRKIKEWGGYTNKLQRKHGSAIAQSGDIPADSAIHARTLSPKTWPGEYLLWDAC